MMDVKWIKLTTNIFDNRKIRQIETLPDGDSIIVIWVKLLCLAGTTNDCGYIYLTKDIPYTDQMLASQFNRPLATVQLALQTFEQFGMIEVVDNFLLISNWEKYQNVDRLSELREYNRLAQQKSREKKKLMLDVNDMSMTSQTSQGIDIDIDKELDIEKNKSKRFIKPTLNELGNYITENNLNVNPQKWLDYYESNGFMVGRNHMKDWKACVRRWSNTNEKEKPNSTLPKYEYTNKAKSLSREEIERELAKAGKL